MTPFYNSFMERPSYMHGMYVLCVAMAVLHAVTMLMVFLFLTLSHFTYHYTALLFSLFCGSCSSSRECALKGTFRYCWSLFCQLGTKFAEVYKL